MGKKYCRIPLTTTLKKKVLLQKIKQESNQRKKSEATESRRKVTGPIKQLMPMGEQYLQRTQCENLR